MTLPIERFKDAYYNWRYNPFTDTDMAVDKVEDGLIIPGGAPFIIQLLEQARYNDPTSVAVRCYGVDTTVDETSADGQPVLKVASTVGFSDDDTVIINRGGDREEEKIIDSVQVGVSLTMTVNLEFEHTAAQADVVEKYIAFVEAAGAPAQSQFRVDYPPDDGGEGTGLVEFNTNDANKEVRITYKATGSPALAETLDTKISYPTGAPEDNQIVGFSSGEPYWLRLPHANLAGLTANNHHPQAHSLASHSTKAHSELTGVSADQHHPQSHTHASHSGIGANDHHPQSHTHASHSGIGANDHHAQVHTHAHGDLTGVSANQHHAQVHTLGSHSDFGSYLDQAVKQASNVQFGTIGASGKVTIGSATPVLGNMFQVRADADNAYAASIENDFAGGWGLHVDVDGSVSADIVFRCRSGSTNRFTVFSDGDLEFATKTSGNSANLYHYSGDEKQMYRFSCSKRYKEKVTDLELDSSNLHKLRLVSYKSLCEGDIGRKGRFHGLIAEEIEQHYPEIVVYNEKNEAESYDTQMLTTLMLAEVQKQRVEIEALKAQLNN